MRLSKILPRYDQKKVCFQKIFELVKSLQQSVSIRGGGGDGGGCDGGFGVVLSCLGQILLKFNDLGHFSTAKNVKDF